MNGMCGQKYCAICACASVIILLLLIIIIILIMDIPGTFKTRFW